MKADQERTCKFCGTVFTPHNPKAGRALYCSYDCRLRWHYQQRWETKQADKAAATAE